ncbi:Hypothetical predicted protein [Mytilus galloprovincialis]|uniref:Uncharacterized protein n=1 Tax=Mytilus galloprovincialis TaxID=29158 RepID=A0A8B6F1R0_MYTGA|nr:Hypothetical predicted protein [Mytilus galloprovincialis]
MSPTNVTVTVKGITVTLIWLSNFNGGFKQFFVVQFRKYDSKSWQSLEPIPDERTGVNKKEIFYSLQLNTVFESLRIIVLVQVNQPNLLHVSLQRGNALLNYVEVSCVPIPKERKFVIHGLENRIPYADIDFTLTADHLPDSSSSSNSSSDTDNE